MLISKRTKKAAKENIFTQRLNFGNNKESQNNHRE